MSTSALSLSLSAALTAPHRRSSRNERAKCQVAPPPRGGFKPGCESSGFKRVTRRNTVVWATWCFHRRQKSARAPTKKTLFVCLTAEKIKTLFVCFPDFTAECSCHARNEWGCTGWCVYIRVVHFDILVEEGWTCIPLRPYRVSKARQVCFNSIRTDERNTISSHSVSQSIDHFCVPY